MFSGRKNEINELNRLFQSKNFQMAVVYGRRRIGKTRLIQEFMKDKKTIYMMAVESNIKTNLELFSSAVYGALETEDHAMYMPTFPDLNSIFRYITQKAQSEKLILVIDEYPYLAQADKQISSLLQNFIDHEWKQLNMMVILCGSSMSFMENQVLGYQSPLFGRRTAQFKLEPLTYYESAEFVPNYTAEEKAIIYGITGGVPQYLEMVDDAKTLKENIMDLYLNKNAYLFEEPTNLMKQEMKDPATYNAIIEAMAKGATKINEIATKLQLETSNVTIYLKALISLGLVEKEYAITERDNRKKTHYRLVDQMFRFWYRYVPQCLFLLQAGKAERAYDLIIKPDLSNYMGPVFERICMQHIQYLQAANALPFDLMELGHWWGNNPVEKRQEEIDLFGVNEIEKKALFGECKFRNEDVDTEVFHTLQKRSELFPQYHEKYYMLYSKADFTDELKQLHETKPNLSLYTIEDLYAHF